MGKAFSNLSAMTSLPTLSLYAYTYTLGELSFDDDETKMNITSFINKDLYKMAVEMKSARVDDKMLAHLPASSPIYSSLALCYTQMLSQYE
jgi:hypothetical protein